MDEVRTRYGQSMDEVENQKEYKTPVLGSK